MDATSLEGMKKVANRFSARHGTPPWWNEIKEPRTVATAQNFVNSITNNPFHSHLKKKKLPFLQNWESDWLPSWERKVKTSDCCQYTKSKPVWYWKRSLCFLAPRSALVCFSFESLRAVESSFFKEQLPEQWYNGFRMISSQAGWSQESAQYEITQKMRLVMQEQQSWQQSCQQYFQRYKGFCMISSQDALGKVHSVKMTAGVASRYWPCLLPCSKVYNYIIYNIQAEVRFVSASGSLKSLPAV